jgi:glycosyltransferase involved in cell wall biosynthesis
LRVLHVVPAAPFGGAQRIAGLLAFQQRRSGLDARVLALQHHPALEALLRSRGVPYGSTGNHSPFNPRGWESLRREVRAFQPDLLHLHLSRLWSLMVLALGVGKRCPWIYHGHSYPPLRLTLKHRMVRALLRADADAVVGVSRSVTRALKDFLGEGEKIWRTIYNGIELPGAPELPKEWPEYLGDIAPGRPLVGMATRFAPDKGIKEFLEALPHLSRRLPEARFVLAGEGPLFSWAGTYGAQLGLAEKLALPGFIEDMPRFWRALDFALFTSPREPFGLRIIEPQAAGVAVLGYFNGSGSDEVVAPGETGVLVDWGDAEKLAHEAAALWYNKQKYNHMVQAARNLIESNFSLGAMGEKSLELYREVLDLNH